MAHEGPCRRPRNGKGGRFQALLRIANEPLDGFGIILAMLPIVILRQVLDKSLKVCSESTVVKVPGKPAVRFPRWMLRSLAPDEDGPLRNSVIQCLEKIASGQRDPQGLRSVFHRFFEIAPTKLPQSIPRTLIHRCGHRGVLWNVAMSEIVYDEIVSLAASDLHVFRCPLHLEEQNPERRRMACRHFFFADPGTESCHRTCTQRLNYLRRTAPKTVLQRKSIPASQTV